MITLKTYEGLQAFVATNPPESVNLEYKGSKFLGNNDGPAVCKAVAAFANSAGGTFIIGIDSTNSTLALDGGWRASSKLDWLYRVINSGTFPAVETIDIEEINTDTGKYYVISVDVSPKAPHQTQNHCYYKRRGSHSDPMEHYEIEDIRNRPKNLAPPLEISLHQEGQLIAFKLRNSSASEVINNLKVDINANFPLEERRLSPLIHRGLRQLRPSVEHVFLIDSFINILGSNPEAELHISAAYERNGRSEKDAVTFYLADFHSALIIQSPVVAALDHLGKKVEAVTNTLEKLLRHTKQLERATDGSGLRLSQRTINALLKREQRFDPAEFDFDGYRVMLDITTDEALEFYHVFGVIGNRRERLKRYKAISAALREKFERVFRIDLED